MIIVHYRQDVSTKCIGIIVYIVKHLDRKLPYLFSISSSPLIVSKFFRNDSDISGAECWTFRYPVISLTLSKACSKAEIIFSEIA